MEGKRTTADQLHDPIQPPASRDLDRSPGDKTKARNAANVRQAKRLELGIVRDIDENTLGSAISSRHSASSSWKPALF
jgi:hypothetical protein